MTHFLSFKLGLDKLFLLLYYYKSNTIFRDGKSKESTKVAGKRHALRYVNTKDAKANKMANLKKSSLGILTAFCVHQDNNIVSFKSQALPG